MNGILRLMLVAGLAVIWMACSNGNKEGKDDMEMDDQSGTMASPAAPANENQAPMGDSSDVGTEDDPTTN